MDTDHDNGVEPYEDDDINAVSLNSSSTTAVTGVTSDRQPLSKFKLFIVDFAREKFQIIQFEEISL